MERFCLSSTRNYHWRRHSACEGTQACSRRQQAFILSQPYRTEIQTEGKTKAQLTTAIRVVRKIVSFIRPCIEGRVIQLPPQKHPDALIGGSSQEAKVAAEDTLGETQREIQYAHLCYSLVFRKLSCGYRLEAPPALHAAESTAKILRQMQSSP